MAWFSIQYEHCGLVWEDEHSSACNDKCPRCNKEIEPKSYEDRTVIVIPLGGGRFDVQRSPDSASYDPDYESLRDFTSQAAAELFAAKIRQRRSDEEAYQFSRLEKGGSR